MGVRAKEAMDAGKLVEDEIVLGMIRERLAEPDVANGFILDGFPRNLLQADALDALLSELGQPLDAVVQMDVEYDELMRRISGRRSCADCGAVFNVLTTPADQIENAKCPKTGKPHKLFQRPDDTEETVAKRLKVYEEKTRPLIDFYREKGILQTINAEGDVEEITGRLEQALQAGTANRAAAAAKRKAPPAKKKAAAKAGAEKAPAKSAANKTPAKQAPAKKAPAKSAAAKKAAGKSAAGKSATTGSRSAGRKAAAKGARPRTAVAKAGRKAKKVPAQRAAPAKKKSAEKKAGKRAGKRSR